MIEFIKGLTFAVIAPSGPADRAAVEAGCAAIARSGAEALVMPNVFKQDSADYLSASRQARLDDFARALENSAVDVLLCARGGFGAVHLLDGIDYALLRERNLPLIGYSDITALHLAMLRERAGRPWVAPMAIRFERLEQDERAQAMVCHLFTGEASLKVPIEIRRGADGFSALPAAINLAVAAAQCGTRHMPDLSGRVVIIEDVGESAYRIDRYLTQLEQSGIFGATRGVVFGAFSNGPADNEVADLLERHLEFLPEFVATGFPFSHDWPVLGLDLTRPLRLENGFALQEEAGTGQL
ncbi:MAG: LD-carboxypeptidase [Victivallaceae bacterium]|nr:LD-carboxypeptidase [Victivallaceae bacterium]